MSGANGSIRVHRQFAGRAKTQGYRPSVLGGAWWNAWLDGKPLFTLFDVERMRKDPMVDFCLRILRAPLCNLKMKIVADSPEVQRFITAQWEKIWSAQLKKMLYCLEYGYAPGETEYAETNGYIQYQALHDVHPLDAKAVQWNIDPYKGLLAGLSVHSRGSFEDESKYSIYFPHAFWFAGETEFGRLYGRPRLAGMYEPWLEKRGRNGAVDSRRLWYRKNAFRGGTMRYPLGTTDYGNETTPDIRNNQDVAREIVEKQENGGVKALPNTPHPTMAGEYAWEYEDAESHPDVAGMRDYPKDLDDEIAVGAGIPVELIHATSSGLGDGGRDLPAIMFFASEDELAKLCIESIDQQQMGPMVRANFGACKYEIKHESLVEIIKRDTSKAKEMTGQEPEQRKPQSQGVSVPGAESTAVQMSQALVDRVAALAATEYPDLPAVELSSSDKGRWITIGAKTGENGGKVGGSPVFVKDGRIVKGHPSLTGKKIGALGEADDSGSTHRQQLNQSKQYERARWAKKARQEGIPVESLNQLADEIRAHDKEFTGQYNDVLKAARTYAEHEGGSLKGLALRADKHGLDHPGVVGFDLVARRVANDFPGYFDNVDDADQQLWDMLMGGSRPMMTHEEALEKAFSTLEEDKHGEGRYRIDKKPSEEFEIPLSQGFDESNVSRDSGKFSSAPGAGAATEQPEGQQKKGGKFRALLAMRHLVPGPVRRKVVAFVSATYTKLEAKYGATGAKMVLTGMVLLSPTPIPGSSLIPIALAEGVKRLRRQFAGTPVAMSTDASGHEHKGKGEGGGQFTAGSGGGGQKIVTHQDLSKAVLPKNVIHKNQNGTFSFVGIVDLNLKFTAADGGLLPEAVLAKYALHRDFQIIKNAKGNVRVFKTAEEAAAFAEKLGIEFTGLPK